MFTLDSRCSQLTRKIEDVLLEGLLLNHDAMHFINSTFSNPTVKALEKIISDETNYEKDPFLALVFFPDESIQVKLEGLLEDGCFNNEEEKNILNYFLLQKTEAEICFPGVKDSLRIKVPDFAVRQFISHLNITMRLDSTLSEAINRDVCKNLSTLVRVKLRNAKFLYTENKINFLRACITKMAPKTDKFIEYLDFILDFLEELKDDTDMFKAMLKKKRSFLKHLQKAESFEKQLAKYNIETLILQGVREPGINVAEIKKKMEMIDKISFSVFGKSDLIA